MLGWVTLLFHMALTGSLGALLLMAGMGWSVQDGFTHSLVS